MKEQMELTDWRNHERQAEEDWIYENLDVLSATALSELDEQGRGLVMVNTNEYTDTLSHPISFLPQAVVEDLETNEPKLYVRDYDPQEEIVVMLVKGNKKEELYRISLINESE